jgi:UDP-N-acetylglucosamine 2-epimerase (non-hydrolysing)
MTPNQSLNDVTASIIIRMKAVLEDCKPDIVLVHGDTATTFAVSLAAYYQQIKVGHVEAGLRTGDLNSPWPEEGNRRLTSVIANYHFAPTEGAKNNLLREGVCESCITVTGNTIIDSLLNAKEILQRDKSLPITLSEDFDYLDENQRMILVTGHRRENFGSGFEKICKAIHRIAINYPNVQILYPVHLNPNVYKPVKRLLGNLDNVFLIEPQQYLSFCYLMNRATIILTDSGGIQEEAPSLGKPVLVMRTKTERPEAINAGTVRLVGNDVNEIIHQVNILLTVPSEYKKMSTALNPYGDGKACKRILDFLILKM